MSRTLTTILTAILVLAAAPVFGEWRIDIESKTVPVDATGVTVDFTLYWDVTMSTVTIPVVVREIDPGAFWTGDLPVDTTGGTPRGITWNWSNPGWAVLFESLTPAEGCATPGNLYDGVSPDNFAISAQAVYGGTPPEPDGRVCIILDFNVSGTPGLFEFDTACATLTLNTIYMVDDVFPPVDHGPTGTGEATFNKGEIRLVRDSDGDGVYDYLDNCPQTHNPGQSDDDDDNIGDACDNCPSIANADQANSDADQWGDACDNCEFVNNANQANADGDLYGDACDNCPDISNSDQVDGDGDNVGNVCDNCPAEPNPGQEDIDTDGIGDACDDCTDFDGDGYGDPEYTANTCPDDNCPSNYNPNQQDSDTDGIGDACDNCPQADNPGQEDTDNDNIGNACDNCPTASNPSQTDADLDGLGDACDACPLDPDNDLDSDGLCANNDNCPNIYNPGQEDADNDGIGDECDDCTDLDEDGFGDPGYPANTCDLDNCLGIFNPEQADSNSDGVGDACDCVCDYYCDLNLDGNLNPVDVVIMVNYIFKARDCRQQSPTCPYDNGDWNCSGSFDPVDVVLYVYYVYRNSQQFGDPCDPCECNPYPYNCPPPD